MHLPCGTFNDSYAKDIAYVRTKEQWIILVASLVFFCILPHLVGHYFTGIFIQVGTTVIIVMGLNVLTGYTGQISLGQAGFAALGGYTSAIASGYYGVPFWFSVPIAATISGAIGTMLLLPALRLRGFYVALATLAAQIVITWGVIRLPWKGAAAYSLSSPELLGIDFANPVNYYYVALACLILITFCIRNLTRTRVGRAWMAIRDNDLAAELLGINLLAYKVSAFFVCCFLAGLGGALWGHYAGSVSVDFYGLDRSIWYLGYLVVGGMGTMLGPFAGTIFFLVLNEVLVFAVGAIAGGYVAGSTYFVLARDVAFGAIFVLFVLFEPRGIAHRWGLVRSYYRLAPFSY